MGHLVVSAKTLLEVLHISANQERNLPQAASVQGALEKTPTSDLLVACCFLSFLCAALVHLTFPF